MQSQSKRFLGRFMAFIMLFTTVFSNISTLTAFAGNGKIDVWDFGGVEEADTALYNNNITKSTYEDNGANYTGGKYVNKENVYGDLTIIANPNSDRLYYDGTYSAGTWGLSVNTYDDGYAANGAYYCNGTGGDTRRLFTIDNVSAGDRISVYGGISNTTDTVLHFLYLGTDGAQDDTATFAAPQRMDFVAKYSGNYKIYTETQGKPYYHRVVRASGVEVTGNIDFSSVTAPGNYKVSFVNSTTNESVDAVVSNNKYTAVLAPGYDYTARISAPGLKVSNASKAVSIVDSDILKGKTADLKIENQVLLNLTGNIIGFDASYDVSKLQIVFTPPEDSLAESVTAVIASDSASFTAKLEPELEYTAELVGVNDYQIKSGATVKLTQDGAQNIEVETKPVYNVSGVFVGLPSSASITSIKFTNLEDNYEYDGTPTSTGYSVQLRNGDYIISTVCSDTNFTTANHVVVNGKDTSKDVKFKDNSPATVYPWVSDVYVGYPSQANNFDTIRDCIKAVATMNPTSEAERITVHIAPGVYREPVTIDTPYLSFVNDEPDKEVKITWYYGIGYNYYSADDKGYFDEDRAFDKYLSKPVSKWGGTVYLKSGAANFYAENITFENSFNKYITDEEIYDIASPDASMASKPPRNQYADVTSKELTERAAAIIAESDNTEFNNCKFIGSQDTLYTGGGTKQYYKNCFIEGNTDYIFGTGSVVFDSCTLNFCGYSEVAMGGYITANKHEASDAELGYLFRNCSITANEKNKQAPGYFGRPWGAKALVNFVNTKLESEDIILPAGWTDMSGNKAENASFSEYNTTYNSKAADTSSRIGSVLTDAEASALNPADYFASWTPKNYIPADSTAPTFTTVPFFTTNDDINTPYPGHIITLGYELDTQDDCSVINWYRVSEDGKEELIKSVAATMQDAKTYKILSKDSGFYIKAEVIPENINGIKGEAKNIKLDAIVREGSSGGGDETDKPIEGTVNVFIAGDSTVKTYTTARGEGGWGEYLQKFFNKDSVNVVNYANGGRSTRNFINEGSLDKIKNEIKAGDYFFIQFGHNDCANGDGYLLDRFVSVGEPDSNGIYPIEPATKEPTPASLSKYGDEYYPYTSGTFKWYLQQYVNVAKEAGATPVLVTPVSRMYFNADGTIKPHHDATDTTTGTVTSSNNAYVTAVKQLAEEEGIDVVDMFTLTKDSFEAAYKADSSAANGVSDLATQIMYTGDKTHCNKIGGFFEGALMAKAIKNLSYNISNYIIKPANVGGYDEKKQLQFEVDKNNSITVYEPAAFTSKSVYWTDTIQKVIDSVTTADTPDEPDANEFKVTYNLKNMSAEGPDKVTSSGALSVTLKANSGYSLPSEISVTMNGALINSGADYTYDLITGLVNIAAVTGDVVITAEAKKDIINDDEFEVTYDLTNLTANGAGKVTSGSSLEFTLYPSDGYKLPKSIKVNMGGIILTQGEDYGYNSSTGTVKIEKVTAVVYITAEAVKDETSTESTTESTTENVEKPDLSDTDVNGNADISSIPKVEGTVTDITISIGSIKISIKVDASTGSLTPVKITINNKTNDALLLEKTSKLNFPTAPSNLVTSKKKVDNVKFYIKGRLKSSVSDDKVQIANASDVVNAVLNAPVLFAGDKVLALEVTKADGSIQPIYADKETGLFGDNVFSTSKDGSDLIVRSVEDVYVEDIQVGYAQSDIKDNNDNDDDDDNNSSSGSSSRGGGGSSSKAAVVKEPKTEDTTTRKPAANINTPANSLRFSDIASRAWAVDSITKLADAGIINGIGGGKFAPDAYSKRADFMIMMVKTLGLEGVVTDNFADVDANKYYANAIGLAKEAGIASGVGNNKFNPEATITRQDMMCIVARALELEGIKLDKDTSVLNKFADSSQIAAYAKEDVATLVNLGIVNGTGNNLEPTALITRAQMSVIMANVYDLLNEEETTTVTEETSEETTEETTEAEETTKKATSSKDDDETTTEETTKKSSDSKESDDETTETTTEA